MVGEIRDRLTARLGLQLGLTGHLVLSTLHAGRAQLVFARLQRLGVDRFLLATAMRAALALRLVRTICVRWQGWDSYFNMLRRKYHAPVGAARSPVDHFAWATKIRQQWGRPPPGRPAPHRMSSVDAETKWRRGGRRPTIGSESGVDRRVHLPLSWAAPHLPGNHDQRRVPVEPFMTGFCGDLSRSLARLRGSVCFPPAQAQRSCYVALHITGCLSLLSTVRVLCRHLQQSDAESYVLRDLPVSRPSLPRWYLYSHSDILSLLQRAQMLDPAGLVQPHSVYMLVGLLAVTGLRIAEALALNLGDVDITHGRLLVRKGKFGKVRYVALDQSTVRVIEQYLSVTICREPR